MTPTPILIEIVGTTTRVWFWQKPDAMEAKERYTAMGYSVTLEWDEGRGYWRVEAKEGRDG